MATENLRQLSTHRLQLRQPNSTDIEACFAIHGDPDTNRFNPAGPDADLATSEKRLIGWIVDWEAHGIGYWIIHEQHTGHLVGFGGLTFTRWRDRDVLNLYYRLTPAMWGRGYATEVGILGVSVGVERWPDAPIVARTRPENISAAACAVRCGLLRTPELDTEHSVYVKNW